MSKRRHAETLRQIDLALTQFPKVLADQRRSYAAREKIQKRFAPMSKKLGRIVDANQARAVKVREHLRNTAPSDAHPDGKTIVHEHSRRTGARRTLGRKDLNQIFLNYDRSGIAQPMKNRFKFAKADAYDDLIAVWSDYFGKYFGAALDVNLVKALIASESGFKPDPPTNVIARGIIQITRPTFDALTNSESEARALTFSGFEFEDLVRPEVSLPLGIRWLFQKRFLAARSLNREPTGEELILEYKGLRRSKSRLKAKALAIFREAYATLTKPYPQ